MEETYKNILVAVDGSDQSEKAFQEAIKIAKRNSATLHILSVIEEMGNYFGELTMSMGTLMEDLRAREEEEMKKESQKLLKQECPKYTHTLCMAIRKR